MQDDLVSERIKLMIESFERCLAGDYTDACVIAKRLCGNTSLLPKLRQNLKSHGVKTVDDINELVISFLFVYAGMCLILARRGKDLLPSLFKCIETMARYLVYIQDIQNVRFLQREATRIPDTAMMELHYYHKGRALRPMVLEKMGTTEAELVGLVLSFARGYVTQCRDKVNPDAIDGLMLLGADCGLDIREAGSSQEEFDGWQREDGLRSLAEGMLYLRTGAQSRNLADREKIVIALGNIKALVHLDPETLPLMQQEKLEWHDMLVLSPDQAGLSEGDVELILRIQRELESGD